MDAPSRTARRPAGGRRPTVRDLVGLAAIALLQPMPSSDYQRCLGMHYDVSRRSLNRLRDLGLVRAHVSAMERPRLYTLTPAGAREVARMSGRDPGEVPLLRAVPEAGLPHHEATVRAVVSLLVACARSGRFAVLETLLDRDLRARAGNPRGALVPDAAMSFSPPGGGPAPDFAVAVEADLGTENPSWFAAQKAGGYAALRAAGRPLLGSGRWAVLVTVPTLRRLHRLASASVGAGAPEGLLYFAVASEVTADAALAGPWRTFRPAGAEGEYRLVAESPFAAVLSDRPVRQDGAAGGIRVSEAGFNPTEGAADSGRGVRR